MGGPCCPRPCAHARQARCKGAIVVAYRADGRHVAPVGLPARSRMPSPWWNRVLRIERNHQNAVTLRSHRAALRQIAARQTPPRHQFPFTPDTRAAGSPAALCRPPANRGPVRSAYLAADRGRAQMMPCRIGFQSSAGVSTTRRSDRNSPIAANRTGSGASRCPAASRTARAEGGDELLDRGVVGHRVFRKRGEMISPGRPPLSGLRLTHDPLGARRDMQSGLLSGHRHGPERRKSDSDMEGLRRRITASRPHCTVRIRLPGAPARPGTPSRRRVSSPSGPIIHTLASAALSRLGFEVSSAADSPGARSGVHVDFDLVVLVSDARTDGFEVCRHFGHCRRID
jgi:hypothetical protein